jgi:hypothetical protein
MKNNLRQIELILYRLKREYGLPVAVRKVTKNDSDVQTGKITSEYAVCKIKRAIRLPSDVMRTFVYDLTYVAANKNFAYGGLFDKDTKVFIIDKKDIRIEGVRVDITMLDHLVCKEKKYDIVKLDETEDGTSYMISAKNIDPTPIILDP